MRRAEIFNLGEIFLQLVVAAAVIGTFWMAVPDTILTQDAYRRAVYAADNALLLETVHAAQEGTLRAAYLLEHPDYRVTLEEGSVTFTHHERETTATRTYHTDTDVAVIEKQFVPRLYQWVKTPDALRADLVTHADNCPQPGVPPDWQDATMLWRGEAEAGIALENALYTLDVRVEEDSGQGGASALEIRREETDTITVTHGPHLETWSVACLARQELVERGVEGVQTRLEQDRDEREGVRVTTPQTADMQTVQESLECAYTRVMQPEVEPGGC